MKTIIEQFDDIMAHRSGIDFSVHEELKEVPLLGEVINLPVRELLLIFFDIERVFDLKIPEEDVLNNGFTTYNNILNIIEKYMNNRKTNILRNKCFS